MIERLLAQLGQQSVSHSRGVVVSAQLLELLLEMQRDLFDDPRFLFIGASIASATRQESFDFSRLDGRPLIYISLGTVHFTNDRFFESAMAALADYPAQFLLSAGRGTDVSRFRDVPANFIVRETFPQLAVLERASLFVSHAGLNSMHESLWYGVPLICVPQQFEQLRAGQRAGRCRSAGLSTHTHPAGPGR